MRIYTQCVFKQRNGVDVYNVQSDWRDSFFFDVKFGLDYVTSRDTMMFMEV